MNFQGLLARRRTMPTPFAPRIILAQNTRSDLQTLARAHSAPQSLALRARIVLRAAEADTPRNVQIGRDLGCSNRTVGKWRQRYHHLGVTLSPLAYGTVGAAQVTADLYIPWGVGLGGSQNNPGAQRQRLGGGMGSCQRLQITAGVLR